MQYAATLFDKRSIICRRYRKLLIFRNIQSNSRNCNFRHIRFDFPVADTPTDIAPEPLSGKVLRNTHSFGMRQLVSVDDVFGDAHSAVGILDEVLPRISLARVNVRAAESVTNQALCSSLEKIGIDMVFDKLHEFSQIPGLGTCHLKSVQEESSLCNGRR